MNPCILITDASRQSRIARWRPWIGALATVLLAAAPLGTRGAQTNSVPAEQAGNRFLFIVNTSEAMLPRAPKVLESLQSLLESDLHGHLREGDSIGLWTYNEGANAGGFPVQTWSPARRQAIQHRVVTYLTKQPLEGKARFNAVWPGIQMIAQRSKYLTIVLFSDGTETFKGTPFDAQIAASYATWKNQQKKNAQPFVTVLGVRDGVFTHGTVSAIPWPIELPPVPPELEKVREEAAKPVAKAPPVGAPLIVSGRKPAEAVAAKPAEPSVAKTPPPTVEKPQAQPTSPAPEQPVAGTPAPPKSPTPPPPVTPVPPNPVPVLPTPVTQVSTQQSKAPPPETKPPELAPPVKVTSPSPVTVPAPETNRAPELAQPTPQRNEAQRPAPGPALPASAAPTSAPRGKLVLVSLIAIPVLGAALVILFLQIRKPKRPAGGSLITRSLDQKP